MNTGLIALTLTLLSALSGCLKGGHKEMFGPIPAPEASFLQGRDTFSEIGLSYLRRYFTLKTFTPLKHYPECEDCACSFEQTFQEGIRYRYNDCDMAGYEIEIIWDMPLSRSHLKKLCERLFDTPANFWNADSTRYQPADGEDGLYLEIPVATHPLVLKYFCSL